MEHFIFIQAGTKIDQAIQRWVSIVRLDCFHLRKVNCNIMIISALNPKQCLHKEPFPPFKGVSLQTCCLNDSCYSLNMIFIFMFSFVFVPFCCRYRAYEFSIILHWYCNIIIIVVHLHRNRISNKITLSSNINLYVQIRETYL